MLLTGDQVWEEVPVPEAPPTGILVKTLASGGQPIQPRPTCAMWLTTGFSLPERPLPPYSREASRMVPGQVDHGVHLAPRWPPQKQPALTPRKGHEGCGRILKFGDKVKDTDTDLKVVSTVAEFTPNVIQDLQRPGRCGGPARGARLWRRGLHRVLPRPPPDMRDGPPLRHRPRWILRALRDPGHPRRRKGPRRQAGRLLGRKPQSSTNKIDRCHASPGRRCR